MFHNEAYRRPEPAFHEAVEPFLRACPGPAKGEKGLRMVAFQDIEGIQTHPRLRIGARTIDDRPGVGSSARLVPPVVPPLRSVKDVAAAVFCSPAYLAKLARAQGYSYSLAVRWVRFFLGIALMNNGYGGKTIASRIGLSDAASWTRFVQRLVGRTPKQLPNLTLEEWARVGVVHVFLAPIRREANAESNANSHPLL